MSPGACILLLLVPLLAALDPAVARAAESGDSTRLVDINGGRKMYLECRGSGSPTVVLIAGLLYSAGWGQARSDYSIAIVPTVPRALASLRSRPYGLSIMGSGGWGGTI